MNKRIEIYNEDNYNSWEEAEKSGAIYDGGEALRGEINEHHIAYAVDAVNDCLGGAVRYRLVDDTITVDRSMYLFLRETMMMIFDGANHRDECETIDHTDLKQYQDYKELIRSTK